MSKSSLSILILGATSGMAQAYAERMAKRGARLMLVARRPDALQQLAQHLQVLGAAQVHTVCADLANTAECAGAIERGFEQLERVDVVLIAQGTLPDAPRTETDLSYAVAQFQINATGVIACLQQAAQHLQAQGSGRLAVIGSVAGDRGRASNALYGAAKAAVHTYASGLRAQLWRNGVHVTVIKPGFVRTRMTEGLPLPGLLTISAAQAGEQIEHAIDAAPAQRYVARFWALIMLIIRLLPDFLFKRLKI